MTLTTGTYYTSVLTCGDQMMVVQFTIQAAAEVPLYTHPHEFHPVRDDYR